MTKLTNILMVGVGGQGIITSSDIIAEAAQHYGQDVKKSGNHGMSQRGGSVFSHIRYGNRVYSPTIPLGQADVLFSLEEMETLRWIEYANPNTTIIILRNRILPSMVETYPSGIIDELKKSMKNIYVVEPDVMKNKISEKKYMNVALCGALSNFIDIPKNSWDYAIKKIVPKHTVDDNIKAFQSGCTLTTR